MDNAMNMEERLLEKGEFFFAKGSLDLAVQMFREVLDLNPRRKEAHNNLGCVFFQQGVMDKAEESLLRAYAQDCDYLNAAENLAELYKQMKNYRRELFFRQEAVKIEQDNPSRWNALALCWLELGNAAEVQRAFEKSLSLDGGQAQIRDLLAELASMNKEAAAV
ncbi:tetratricopeptide repeat protein [Desulfuromonas sp. KJ2020]|uniref:tetratricopeptide repeat protein n=1 Tax=Desulfuromonas sp. KJ2020 TaxID=2919173 RepID=UPI0020A78338|nr:tetratricopeptide repeat protein [Desulfuromonas sp. KJ2020]MCP3178442.1 tetratricopeptide repeat protein [Desulfuromonas sp. KJ2020]